MRTETAVVLGVVAFLLWQSQQKPATVTPPPPQPQRQPQGDLWVSLVDLAGDVVDAFGGKSGPANT